MDANSSLEYVIQHVFLPPQLPQEDDDRPEKSAYLIEELSGALAEFQAHIKEEDLSLWATCGKMIANMKRFRSRSGELLTDRLREILRGMASGDVVALPIRSQNAGLIIRKSEAAYSFESFELSPANGEVIGAKGRLQRCFPGPAVVVDETHIQDASFLENLMGFLGKLDAISTEEVASKTRKAGSTVRENRDTVNPQFITEMLTGILRAIGKPLDIPRIHKRTREDVLWKDALNPWRRSPLWLLLRITLQTTLITRDGSSQEHFCYKSFMIFFMSRLLDKASKFSVSDDLLFVMMAKISRRVQKLGVDYTSSWLAEVMDRTTAIRTDMARRWKELESDPDPHQTQSEWQPKNLCFPHDASLSLETLRPYLTSLGSRNVIPSNINNFAPNCFSRILQSSSKLPNLNLPYTTSVQDRHTFLFDLELWVENCLADWLNANISCVDSCTALKSLLDTYTLNAVAAYKGQPADISLMCLTLMDLWVAIDKCTIYHYPLLEDYSPEFPTSLMEPLLLPKKPQMQRLIDIERYLTKRRERAVPGCPSIFRSIKEPKSFAVRYFDQSPKHGALRLTIESGAKVEKSKKLSELREKRQEYDKLLEKSANMNCDYVDKLQRRGWVTVHSSGCTKCHLSSTAHNLRIDIHEWPLPRNELEAKAVIFELDVPDAISAWRDATYGLLVDIFSGPRDFSLANSTIKSKIYGTNDHRDLRALGRFPKGRIQVASQTKPFLVTHYNGMPVWQAREDNVCLNHGMLYEIYDSRTANWAPQLLDSCDVREKCTYDLQSLKYDGLQYAIGNTTHLSNEVIARQSNCPQTLTLHEYYAFGTLRSGHRLQWRNIGRELIAQVLDFSHEETHSLIIQTIWQAGPLHQPLSCLESHIDPEDEGFGKSLANLLDGSIKAVEGNWQAVVAVRTFAGLAARLLSLTNSDTVLTDCFRILRRAREITLGWSRELREKLQERQSDEAAMKSLNERTLEMALTCHGTFDVELKHLPGLLKSKEDVAALIECSITIHDHCPPSTENLRKSTKLLLQRYSRLTHLLEPFARQHLAISSGLDNAIRKVWAGYKPGKPWVVLPVPNDRWLKTETSGESGFSSMTVHYNILDGTLLVNGSPLTRLPSAYEGHTTYRRILSEKVLDVVPSTMANMTFETRNELFGHQVHFGMRGPELIIRTRKRGRIHELLPVHALESDFPQAFVRDYAHWLDVESGIVEWRPLSNPWEPSMLNWRMEREGYQYVLSLGASRLIDVRSRTAKAISSVLGPLEQSTHIHITINSETGYLDINLPRMKLGFFLKPNSPSIESKQYRGTIVDQNQSFGTLTGLVNKLVLRRVNDSAQSVIVPHGDVSFEKHEQHVLVRISTSSSRNVSHHFYQVDTVLGRLIDNGSMRSRLFKYYLHAVTSNCVQDGLTGKTGTEESISGLRAPSSRSFLKLGAEDIKILKLISKLTPQRGYYPTHLREMQSITWNGELSPLAQHPLFSKLVGEILDIAESFRLFQDNPTTFRSNDIRSNEHLRERSIIQQASIWVQGYGTEEHRSDEDRICKSRDRLSMNDREHKTYIIGTMVEEWSINLKGHSELLGEFESWKQPITGFNHPGKRNDHFVLGFDFQWLDDPSTILPLYWYNLQNVLSRSSRGRDKYRIMFLLCTLTFSQKWDPKLVQTLLALATVPEVRAIQPPHYSQFVLSDGYSPNKSTLKSLVDQYERPFSECPERNLPKLAGESEIDARNRRTREHNSIKSSQIEEFVNSLVKQWPLSVPQTPRDVDYGTHIRVDQAMKAAKTRFQLWFRNYEFKIYINKLQEAVTRLSPRDENFQKYSFVNPPDMYRPQLGHVSFYQLIKCQASTVPRAEVGNFNSWVRQKSGPAGDRGRLEALLNSLKSSSDDHGQRYIDDLFESSRSLREDLVLELGKAQKDFLPELEKYSDECKKHVGRIHDQIYQHLLTNSSKAQRHACDAGMWPRLNTTSLLSHLSQDRFPFLNESWKKILVEFGIAITMQQRAGRLLSCAENTPDLLKELETLAHHGWDPLHYPDWLLLEIENNILIRRVQAQVAQEMISPTSGKNSIMQLNMGEGKSSVIVPIVAAALADTTKLARVVVLKPLSSQMFHLLVQKLGGLLNRPVLHLPISRSLRLDVESASRLAEMYQKCMREGGILLVQPEHLLSFELMGFDFIFSGKTEVGDIMIETQRWLDRHSRDILDESDEILSVKFELIYTMGTQRAIDFSPDRWVIIQEVLRSICEFAVKVLEDFPEGLEVNSSCKGCFPRLRIIQPAAGNKLLELVATKICSTGLPGIPVWNLRNDIQDTLFRFLTDPSMAEVEAKSLEATAFQTEYMRTGVLLLKGLLAGGVLRFALESKRWRVNYGLDPSRTMLAVPYRAKDSPAARAEFSHPDATIVFTCLSYYYAGLTDSQLKDSFEKLLLSGNAQQEYENWVHDAPDLPEKYRRLNGINLLDVDQCSQHIFPRLRYSIGVINFYLSNIVFPKEMKEFPHKLSSSGWDIAREKYFPTTGFSGTNDSRYILPLSIAQINLPEQRHTNATQLDCLLRPENDFYRIGKKSTREGLDAKTLLQAVVKADPPIRVILDVGAQVLELRNEEVAEKWLLLDPDPEVQAAIYFDDSSELTVLSRDGTRENLMVSTFRKQMDRCLVYLDEAHTRGTDLKLPINYRAAVTLGPNLTKDRLVQACMRMRRLGEGQSVLFCAPMEVERKILKCSGKALSDPIEVTDVLRWSIKETFGHIRKSIPLWATQGTRYQRRSIAWSESEKYIGSTFPDHVAETLLEPEAQSIQKRYGFEARSLEEDVLTGDGKDRSLSKRGTQLDAIREKCRQFEIGSFNSATLQEEQERELSPENEREQQVERPPSYHPRPHKVSEGLRDFVKSGALNHFSNRFTPAFELFRQTSSGKSLEPAAWTEDLAVTDDFWHTVQIPKGQYPDMFLRPVQWIVSSRCKGTPKCIIISPFEANILLPEIRKYEAVTLHVYSPRTGGSMRSLDDLSLFALPAVPKTWTRPAIVMQLNLFSGQLYVRDYDEYLALCRFLGLSSRSPDNDEVKVFSDGFVNPRDRMAFDEMMASQCGFQKSPVGFLRALMALRRKGQSFQKSHIGAILNGELLKVEDFSEL